MAAYYITFAFIAVIFVVAAATVLIHAINRKGDVNASFWVRSFGFTLETKHRPDQK